MFKYLLVSRHLIIVLLSPSIYRLEKNRVLRYALSSSMSSPTKKIDMHGLLPS